MARSNDRDRGSERGPKDLARRGGRKKVCIFCKDHIHRVDYNDANLLRRFMSDRGRIRARRVTGNCAQHQRDVAMAIKTAREVALLPYTQRTVTERGGRGEGRGRGPRPGHPAAPEAPAEAGEPEGSGDVERAEPGEPEIRSLAVAMAGADGV
jgi:small subunit ribosomal protein S18